MAEKATTPRAKREPKKRGESHPSPNGSLAEALASEAQIRMRAAEIRGTNQPLSYDTLNRLYPLLIEEIPRPFLQHVGRVKGKPYESTGIKSVQVQIDRLNNVLGPTGWSFSEEFANEGKLCKVTARILGKDGVVLVERTSFGGVDYASTLGNLYKGSFTNAAKVAFARLGPGHEIYIGIEDLDPDVSEQAAKAQAEAKEKRPSKSKPEAAGDRVTDEQYEILRQTFKAKVVDQESWRMFLLSQGVERTADLAANGYTAALEWLDARPDKEGGGDDAAAEAAPQAGAEAPTQAQAEAP